MLPNFGNKPVGEKLATMPRELKKYSLSYVFSIIMFTLASDWHGAVLTPIYPLHRSPLTSYIQEKNTKATYQ